MSGGDGSGDTVADLKATIGKAMDEIGRVQSALSVVKDRIQTARDIIKIGTKGSGATEVDTSMAALVDADMQADEAIKSTMISVQNLAAWLATR